MFPRFGYGSTSKAPQQATLRGQPTSTNSFMNDGHQTYGATNSQSYGDSSQSYGISSQPYSDNSRLFGTNSQPYGPTSQSHSQPYGANSQQYGTHQLPYDANQAFKGGTKENLPNTSTGQAIRSNMQNHFGSTLSYVVEDQSNPLYGESRGSMNQSRAASNIQSSSVMVPPYNDVLASRSTKPHSDLMSTGKIQPLLQVRSGYLPNQPTTNHNPFYNKDRGIPQERLAPQSINSEAPTSNHLMVESSNVKELTLPQRVYERKCKVEMVQEFLQCGILILEGGDNRKEYCFFFKKDFLSRDSFSGNVKMSLALPKGKELLANAKLADEGGRVPYLATTVWEEGAHLDTNLMSKVFAPISHSDLEKFKQLSLDLAWCLPKIVEESAEESVLSSRLRLKSASPPNLPSYKPSPERFSGHSSRSISRKETSPIQRKRSPVSHTRRSRSPIGLSQHSRSSRPSHTPQRVRKRSRSPISPGRDETKRSRRKSTCPPPMKTCMGKLLSYDEVTKIGVINQHNQNGEVDKVCFHLNQVWVTYSNIGSIQFLEVFPTTDFSSLFPEGCRLEYVARKIPPHSGYKFQAFFVWKSGEKIPELVFEKPGLVDDLDLKLSHLNYTVSRYPDYLVNPIKGTPHDSAVKARVYEYLSLEMGVLKLEDDIGSVVLFHLNQVWTYDENRDLSLLKHCQKDTLELTYLPIGTFVMVHMRRLPAHQNSQLCYQAVVLWQPKVESSSKKLPSEYYKMYEHSDNRVKLLHDLDLQHDNFKKISNLGFPSPDGFSLIKPVPAVLNGLPQSWKAVVVAKVNEDFGIIRISHKASLNLSEQSEIKMIHAMFHLEDVYGETGLSSFDVAIRMTDLVNKEVDLTARSIAFNHDSPTSLLKMQTDLKTSQNPNDVGTPILQAIFVQVKAKNGKPTNTLTIPQPTCLRSEPGTFNPHNKATPFYLNFTIRLRLNIKLRNFLELPDKLGLPYGRVIHPFLERESLDEGSKLLDLKKVDVNKSSRFIYGDFNPSPVKNEMKENILTNFPCTVKYLHQSKLKSKCGILEVTSGTGSFMGHKKSSFVFFELSDYKFFTPPTYFASDLANVTPVNSKDRYHVTAYYVNSNPLVPYIATSVWNEDLRIELGQPIPNGPTFVEMKRYISEKNRLIEDIINSSGNDTHFEIQKTLTDKNKPQTFASKPCFYGSSCSKPNCKFDHDYENEPTRLDSGELDPSCSFRSDPKTKEERPCKFGSKCSKPNCKFFHSGSDPKTKKETPCKFGSKCSRPNCKFYHSEEKTSKDIDLRKSTKQVESDTQTHVKRMEQVTNQEAIIEPSKIKSEESKIACYFGSECRFGSKCTHPIEVPSSVGTVDTAKFHLLVKQKWKGKVCVNKNSVLTQGHMIVEYIDDSIGVVEAVLNGHYGVLKYSKEDNKKETVRIIFSINDVILEHSSSAFKSIDEIFDYRAPVKNPSANLYTLLKEGDQVRFSAVMLVSGVSNAAEINYYCVGLHLETSLESPVPFMPIKSSKFAIPEWKQQYEDLLSCLTSNLKIKKMKKFSEAKPLESHYKRDYKLRPLKFGDGTRNLDLKVETIGPNKVLPEENVITIDDDDDDPKGLSANDRPVFKKVLKFQIGRVVKIVNGQYGLAAIVYRKKNATKDDVFQVLFDITDVWLGDETLDMLGKTLDNVMKVGDTVMLHGMSVNYEFDSQRKIKFMATSLVTADSLDNLAKLKFPAQAASLENIALVDQKKIENFKTVVEILDKSKVLPNEEVILNEIAQENLNENFYKIQGKNYEIEDCSLKHLLTDDEKINGDIYKQYYFCYHCKVVESFLDESKTKIEIGKNYTKNHKNHMTTNCGEDCIETGKKMFKELKSEFEQCLSENSIIPAMLNQRPLVKHIATKQIIYECTLCENRQFANFFSHLKRELHQKQVKLKFGRIIHNLNSCKEKNNKKNETLFEENTSKFYRYKHFCFHCQESHGYMSKTGKYVWKEEKYHRKHLENCDNKDECVKEGKEFTEDLIQYFDTKVETGAIIVYRENSAQISYHCNVCNINFNQLRHVLDHKDFRPNDKEYLEAKINTAINEGLGIRSDSLYFCFHCKRFETYLHKKDTLDHDQHIKNCIEDDCVKLGKELYERLKKVFKRCLEEKKIEKRTDQKALDKSSYICHFCKGNRVTNFMHIHNRHPSIVEEYTADFELLDKFENLVDNGDIKLWREADESKKVDATYCCLHCVSFFKKLAAPKHLKGELHTSHMANCVNHKECIKVGEETAQVRDLVKESTNEWYIVKVKTEDQTYLWKCLHCEVNFKTKDHLESETHLKHMNDCNKKCWKEKQRIAEEKERVEEEATKEAQRQLSVKSALKLANNLYYCFHCKVKDVEIFHFADPFHTNHVKNCGTKMEDCPENPNYNKEISISLKKKEIVQFPDSKFDEDEKYDSAIYDRYFCFHCQIGFSSRLHIAKSHKQHMTLNICTTKCRMIQYHGSGKDSKSSCSLCKTKYMSKEQHDLHLKCSSHKRAIIEKLRKRESEIKDYSKERIVRTVENQNVKDGPEFLTATNQPDKPPLIELEDSENENENCPEGEKLPNVVINQCGYVLKIFNKTCAVGRFDYRLYVIENDEWVDKQLNVLFDNKSLLISEEEDPIESLTGVIKPGDKIRFHGIKLHREVKKIGDIVQYYSDCVLYGDKCKTKELQYTKAYQKWLRDETRLKYTLIWKHKRNEIEDGFEAIEKSKDEVLQMQLEQSLVNSRGTVIHVESLLSIIQIDQEDKATTFALYIQNRKVAQSQVGSKSRLLQQMAKDAIRLNHSVLLNSVLVDPLGPIQYLATSVWADMEGVEEPDVVPLADVFEKVLEKFRQLIPRVVYVPQVWQSCPERIQEEITLEQFTPSQVRKIILVYSAALEKLKIDKEANFDIHEIAKGAKLTENTHYVKPFLLVLSNKCHMAEIDSYGIVKGIKLKQVFVNATQVELVRKEGLQTLKTALPTSTEDKLNWRIPSNWKVERETCKMDLGENWDDKDDSMLVVGFLEHGSNWSKIQKDSKLNLKEKITGENGKVREVVKLRLEQLNNMIIFRGRISDEALDISMEGDCDENESDLENYMDEDELNSLATLKEKTFENECNIEKETEVMVNVDESGGQMQSSIDVIKMKESDIEGENKMDTSNSTTIELPKDNSPSSLDKEHDIEMEVDSHDIEAEIAAQIDRDLKELEEEFKEEEKLK